jgi:MED7 protein
MAEDSRIVSALPLPPPYYKLFAPKAVKGKDAVHEELAGSSRCSGMRFTLCQRLDQMLACIQMHLLPAVSTLKAVCRCFAYNIQNEDSKYPLQPPPFPLPGTTYESFGTTCKVNISF